MCDGSTADYIDDVRRDLEDLLANEEIGPDTRTELICLRNAIDTYLESSDGP